MNLTLDQAYQAALQKTEMLPIQQSLVAQSKARVSQERGKMLPSLSAGANYTHQKYKATASSVFYTPDEVETKLTLTQPIFEGGRLYSGLKKSKYDLQSAKENLRLQKINLYLGVAQAYYNVLNTRKKIENLKTIIDLTKKQIGELKKRARIGRSRVSEVLSAKSQLAVSESQLASAQGQMTVYLDQLSLATNMPALTTISAISLKADIPQTIPPLNRYLDSMDARPDLQSLKAQLNAQNESLKVARSGHWFTIDASGDYVLSQTGYRNQTDWDAGLSLKLPLFEGGTVAGEVQEAAQKKTQLILQLAQAKRSAESEIRSAYDSLQSSLKEIQSLEKAVDAAQKNYRRQQSDYRLSLVTNLDVLQALSMFHDTKLSLDQTRVQAALNWAQLRASVAQIPD